jgi:hypothetical protein
VTHDQWPRVSQDPGYEVITILWPRLPPDVFDDNRPARYPGIGSVLEQRHRPDVAKLVTRSGYDGYKATARVAPSRSGLHAGVDFAYQFSLIG